MESQIDILDRLYSGLKIKDAIYTEKNNICSVNFLYNPESFTPDEENTTTLKNKLIELTMGLAKIELNFIRCPLDKRAIATHTYTTLVNSFPAIAKNFTFDDVKVDILDMSVTVTLKLATSAYEYAKSLNREDLIADKLKESFLAEFKVQFEEKKDIVSTENIIEQNMEFQSSIKAVEDKTIYVISNIQNIVGKADCQVADSFTRITSPIDNVYVCGTITRINRATYMQKSTKNGTTKETERAYFRFSLNLEGKYLNCVIFPRQADEQKCTALEENMKVIVYGSFKQREGHGLSFTANAVAKCDYEKREIKASFKHVNDNYHTVFPSTYEYYEQSGLFDEEDKKFEGSYVVFDLETTGLNAATDEIIEIGACKVQDGSITEVFSTFVKPTKPVPAEITELTHITNDMVKDAPTINYVLPDFYKFCYGSKIVGHNVQFDIGFIYNVAKKFSYNFDNELVDTLEMARKKLPGLKNYKLGTVVEKLGVTLDGAHRAINDATATAKIFIKLM